MSYSNVSSVTNHFATPNEGFSTTAADLVTSGGNVVMLDDATTLTDASIFVGVIEPGEVKEQVFTGTVDKAGSRITDVVWTRGTNVEHAAGVTIVDYDTGTAFNMMRKGILVSLNQDGTLKNNAVTTASILNAAVTSAKVSGIDKSLLTTDSNPYKCSVYRLLSTTLTGNTSWQVVPLNAEFYDTNSNYDNTTYTYTAPVSGFYNISASLNAYVVTGTTLYAQILKNGSIGVLRGPTGCNVTGSNNDASVSVSGDVQLTAGDTIQFRVACTQSGTYTVRGYEYEVGSTMLSIHLISRT